MRLAMQPFHVKIPSHLPNTRWGMLLRRWISSLELYLLRNYKRDPHEREGINVVSAIYAHQSSNFAIIFRGATTVLHSPGDLFNLWAHARTMRDHGGAFAEVGAFKGDSAEVICKAKGGRSFYVFEAFTGLRSIGMTDRRFLRGMFASTETDLRHRLSLYPSTTLITGYFPETATPVASLRFSFVHLDVDTYEDTLRSLQFFYPRMLPGGRIISHDYGQCEGVWTAVDEFFVDKPERVEPLGAIQVLVIRGGSVEPTR